MRLSDYFPKDISDIPDLDVIHGVMKNALYEFEQEHYIEEEGEFDSPNADAYYQALVDVYRMTYDLYFTRGDLTKSPSK